MPARETICHKFVVTGGEDFRQLLFYPTIIVFYLSLAVSSPISRLCHNYVVVDRNMFTICLLKNWGIAMYIWLDPFSRQSMCCSLSNASASQLLFLTMSDCVRIKFIN